MNASGRGNVCWSGFIFLGKGLKVMELFYPRDQCKKKKKIKLHNLSAVRLITDHNMHFYHTVTISWTETPINDGGDYLPPVDLHSIIVCSPSSSKSVHGISRPATFPSQGTQAIFFRPTTGLRTPRK